MAEGILKKRIRFEVDEANAPEEGYWVRDIAFKHIDEAKQDMPTLLKATNGTMDMRVFEESTSGRKVNWEKTVINLSNFIMEYESKRKKWFGDTT